MTVHWLLVDVFQSDTFNIFNESHMSFNILNLACQKYGDGKSLEDVHRILTAAL